MGAGADFWGSGEVEISQVNKSQLLLIFQKTQGHCYFCGDPLEFEKRGWCEGDLTGYWEIDHIIQRAKEEPRHIHVQRENKHAKFWLDPILLAESYGFRGKELREVERIIVANRTLLQEAWDEHCARA